MKHVPGLAAWVVLAASGLMSGSCGDAAPEGDVTPSSLAPMPTVILPGPMSSPTITLIGEPYVNDAGGYSFNVPPGWNAQRAKRPDAVTVWAPGATRSTNVSLSVIRVPVGTSLRDYQQQNLGFLQFLPGFVMIDQGDETLGGLPAYQLHYAAAPKGVKYESVQITALDGTLAYTAIYTSDPKHFQRYFTDAGLIVRSFALTG